MDLAKLNDEELLQLETLLDFEYRDKARSSFLEFCRYIKHMGEDFIENDFSLESCIHLEKFLEDVEKDRITNKSDILDSEKKYIRPKLISQCPSGIGKSYLYHDLFLAYAFGKYPNFKIIASSYSDDLIKRNNEQLQQLMLSEKYIELFGNRLNTKRVVTVEEAKRNMYAFDIVGYGGKYRCVTLRGGITGFRANIFIIDDPIKGVEQALSKNEKDKIENTFNTVVKSRMQRGYGTIIIQQRWAVDDLVGRVLENNPDAWTNIKFKALREDEFGNLTSLCSELLPVDNLLDIRQGSPMFFSAMYQQEPVSWGGGIIDTRWFQEWDLDDPVKPKFSRVYLVCDTALKSTGDYWVIQVWGRTKDKDRYLIDIYREKTEYDKYKNDLIDIFNKYKRLYKASAIFIEDKTSGTILISDLKKERLPVQPLKAEGSKFFRLSLVMPVIKNGYVYIPKNHHHKIDLTLECERFRADEKHGNDDLVDCLVYGIGEQTEFSSTGYNKNLANNINDIFRE